MRYSRCVVCNHTVGWIGLMANLALSLLKLFVGLISGSYALMADALYSAKDVVTSVLIIIGLKISSQPVDEEHPFGHGKIEFIFSLVVSLILIGLTALLFYRSAETLLVGQPVKPHLIALWTALLSVAVSFFLRAYTQCVTIEINSPIVHTLSLHHKSSGFSSTAVALGILGSHYLDIPELDTMVALGGALFLVYIGGAVFWGGFKGLMDTSAPLDVLRHIRRVAESCSGVQSIEQIRTRLVGQELWIDMTIGVDPDLSVGSAKVVSRRVEELLETHIPHVGDIGVHFKSMPGSVPEMEEMKENISLLSDALEEASLSEEDRPVVAYE